MNDRSHLTRIEVEPGVEIVAHDLGTGPPVVLLAGWGLSHQVWDRQVRLLAPSHRVICIDLRGTGDSDKPLTGYAVERLAADVDAVLERLEVTGAALVGWSFGGQVAFRLAATEPGRVARLALIGTNGVRASRGEGFPFGRPPEQLEPELLAGEEGPSRPAFRRGMVAGAFHREPERETLDWLLGITIAMPSWAGAACLRSMLRTDQLAALAAVSMPVLQIVGDHDPVCSLKGARWLEQELADARLVELPDCGHYPMFEAPDRFDEALLGFAAEGMEASLLSPRSR